MIAVPLPTADVPHAVQGCGAQGLGEVRVIGERLHAAGEGSGVAYGDDVALLAVGEEVLATCVFGAEDRAAAGQGLGLHEGKAFLDGGEHKQVTAAHEACEFPLGQRSEELDVLGGELVQQGSHLGLQGACNSQPFAWVAQGGEGLKQIGHAFAETDRAGEEDVELVSWWIGGGLELVQPNAVGDDVNLVGRDAVLDEGAAGDGGRDGDRIGYGVDSFFAGGVAGVGDGAGYAPAAVLVGDDLFLVALMCGAAVAEEEAALALEVLASAQAGSGDADEDVGALVGAEEVAELPVGPAVKGERVAVAELVGEPGKIEGAAAEGVFGDV